MTPRRRVDALGIVAGRGSDHVPDKEAGRAATSGALAQDARLQAAGHRRPPWRESPLLQSWRLRAAGGPPHAPTVGRGIEAFVQDTFGLPGSPGTANLVQGCIGELLLHRLLSAGVAPAAGRTPSHAAAVSWAAAKAVGTVLV